MPNYKATGRPPSNDPRRNVVTVKLSDAEKERLDLAAEILDITKTKVIVEGINRMMNEAGAVAYERQREHERR